MEGIGGGSRLHLGLAAEGQGSHPGSRSSAEPLGCRSFAEARAAPPLPPTCAKAALDTHQCPEDINGEKCYGEGNQADGLQAAVELQVVLGPSEAQPARDGGQWGDEEETHHVAKEGPLFVTGAWVLQPLQQETRKGGERGRVGGQREGARCEKDGEPDKYAPRPANGRRRKFNLP